MEEKTTVEKLFHEKGIKFSIPAYQRAYSWECDKDRKQVEQFIIDIKDQDPKKPYFLGHFLFEKDKDDKNKYWVIDGQQRLTTVVIFFSCLIQELEKRKLDLEKKRRENTLEDKMHSSLSDIKLFDENGEEIQTWRIREDYIQMGKDYKFSTVEYDNPFFKNLVFQNCDAGNAFDTESQKRIANAKKAFEYIFEKAEIHEILTWKKIVEEAVITTFQVDDKIQATQIFAFQNDRGKDLTTLEKLKAFLMHKVYAVSDDPVSVIKEMEMEFCDIYRQSERISFDEDRVLGFHNVAFLPGSGNALDNVKSAIKVITENEKKEEWIKRFVYTLKETFHTIEKIEKIAEQNNSITDSLLLDTQNSIPLLIKLFHFHKQDEKTIFEVMKIVENILFRLIYRSADYRTNSLPTIAKNYNGDIVKLKESLQIILKHGFQDWWDFTGSCKNYFLKNSYHYSSNIKYVLWKYENYLRDVERARLLTPIDFKNKYETKRKENTIDHITPQTPNFTEYSDDFKRDFLNNIGNLGLMVWGDNSAKKDNNPVDKIDLFDKDFFSNKKIKQVLETKKTWGENEIIDRRDKIIKFIFDNWNLN
ncbi:MAG: DUF262 domain-containing HNH endonuclease family protein [Treponema sp.]|nr:DUF262 domain-containing HNH endonuclease family protein [Treponema sp.]